MKKIILAVILAFTLLVSCAAPADNGKTTSDTSASTSEPLSTAGDDTEKVEGPLKILFLGNSFTYYNDLPEMLSTLSDGALLCKSVTRGGGYLSEYSETDSEVRGKLDALLASGESFDFVVLQEQSLLPATDAQKVLESAQTIVKLIPDTNFVLYQTWSYKRDTQKLESTGFSFEEMTEKLAAGYRQVGDAIGALVVPVGKAFAEAEQGGFQLYQTDNYHPNKGGTYLAACLFYRAFTGNSAAELDTVEGVSASVAYKLRAIADSVDVPSLGR